MTVVVETRPEPQVRLSHAVYLEPFDVDRSSDVPSCLEFTKNSNGWWPLIDDNHQHTDLRELDEEPVKEIRHLLGGKDVLVFVLPPHRIPLVETNIYGGRSCSLEPCKRPFIWRTIAKPDSIPQSSVPDGNFPPQPAYPCEPKPLHHAFCRVTSRPNGKAEDVGDDLGWKVMKAKSPPVHPNPQEFELDRTVDD